MLKYCTIFFSLRQGSSATKALTFYYLEKKPIFSWDKGGAFVKTKHERPVRFKGGLDMIMDRIALIIAVIGALNWGSIGLFRFDLVAWIFGGQSALGSRIVYTVVALAGIWCVSLIFRARERFEALDE